MIPGDWPVGESTTGRGKDLGILRVVLRSNASVTWISKFHLVSNAMDSAEL